MIDGKETFIALGNKYGVNGLCIPADFLREFLDCFEERDLIFDFEIDANNHAYCWYYDEEDIPGLLKIPRNHSWPIRFNGISTAVPASFGAR